LKYKDVFFSSTKHLELKAGTRLMRTRNYRKKFVHSNRNMQNVSNKQQ